MRPIGEFDNEERASTFSGYLNYKGISCEVEEDDEGKSWTVWAHNEETLAKAIAEIHEFRQKPDASKYAELAREAQKQEKKERKIEGNKASRWREETLRDRWQDRNRRPGIMTMALIITCAATFFVSKMGENTEPVGTFYISEYVHLGAKDAPVYLAATQTVLPEVMEGQVWRVITPIFLHFGFLHILFNMFWLHDLGSLIENRRGTGYFVAFILLAAIISNIAQYCVSGPSFGGMSGVVYGLFGYVWMKGKFDPGDGIEMNPSTVTIMLAWFALCFTGIFGHVANWAHAAGLAVGTLWGYASAMRWTGKRG
ncbi:MAG: rhomboid family intramembrane serine protease [Opitutales bacterium]